MEAEAEQPLPQTRVRPSAIHGKGLFSLEPIAKGTLIGRFSGPAARRNGTHVLWYQDDDDCWRGIRVTNKLRYVNHSPHPNAKAWGDELYAARRIRAGEEITWHYGEDWGEL